MDRVVARETTAAKPILRLLVILALLLWLLPLGDLLGHVSDSPTILGRYSPNYVMLLTAYGALALVIASLWRASSRFARATPYSARRLWLAGGTWFAGGIALWVVLFELRTTFPKGTPTELYLTWAGWGLLSAAGLYILGAANLPSRLTWRRHGLVTLVITLVTLGLLEAMVRIAFPYGLQTETTLIINPGQPNPWQPYTGVAYSSGAEFIYQSTVGYRTHVQINSKGLRDLDYPYEKADGYYRVLILGDSMAQAVQVPLEETFQQRLENGLRAAGYGVEVISGAMGNWGTSNEVLYLEYEGCRYEPDLVLLAAFPTNDVGNNDRLTRLWQVRDEARSVEIFHRWINYPYFESSEAGELTVHNLPSPQLMPLEMSIGERFGSAMGRVSTLYLVLHQIMNPQLKPDVTPPAELEPYYGGYPGPEPDDLRSNGGVHLLTFTEPETAAMAGAWRMTAALIERVRTLANDCGADMGVVIVPSYLDQTPLAEAVNQRLAQLAERDSVWAAYRFRSAEMHLASLVSEMGIPFINLMEVMPGDDAAVFLPRDGHFTSLGNEQAANAIHDWLLEQNWLPQG